MPLIDTGLVIRYYMDEAASGTGPSALSDDSGVGDAFNLDITYDGHLAFTEDGGNRGLVSDSTGDLQRALQFIVTADKMDSALTGSTSMTMEVVADISSGAAGTGRVAAINISTGNPHFGFCLTGTDARIYFDAVQVRSWTRVTGRKVYHIVVDTSDGTANNRVLLYVDGSLDSSIDIDANPTQNDTIDVDAARLWLFNRGLGNYQRSIIGTIYYVALYSSALTSGNVSDNYDILTADDDTPGAPPAGIVVLRRRRSG